MILGGATLADGRVVDIRVDADTVLAISGSLAAEPGEERIDLAGRLLLPAPAEPHAHLDKALTADLAPNPAGDLLGAIDAWYAFLPTLDVDGITRRADAAARRLLANGCTAIRTHVNVGQSFGLKAVEALVAVRAAIGHLVDIQIVALPERPVAGADGAGNRAALRAALAAGADIVGGCPHLDPDPVACLDVCLDLAGELAVPLDLHMDETLNPEMLVLAVLAERVLSSGFEPAVTASHCCSLGVQEPDTQRRVAEAVAAAGVAVVALPQTNLFLQGRQAPVATPRGLTALRPLLDAGAVLAAGADNLQDPFNTMGRGDPLETATLMVMAGHLLPDEAFGTVSSAARRVMRMASAASSVVAPGDPAELVAITSTSLRAAIADAPAGRIVVHRGAVIDPAEVIAR
ncbi:MAG TPA: amidohydrolase family protein [Acidimicrobiales bacterium]